MVLLQGLHKVNKINRLTSDGFSFFFAGSDSSSLNWKEKNDIMK
jgi:hypothetical protein